MDQRMQKALYDCENHKIGLDEPFLFKCRECGKCCKNRDDILLTSRDLFNIAQFFNKTPVEIIKRYCEDYIGESSRIPVVRLKPQGRESACPLFLNKHCTVHSIKPVVCALYPIGRAAIIPQETACAGIPEDIQPGYFLQRIKCGSREETHTVRDWLEQFGIPLDDEFYSLWNSVIIFLSDYFTQLEADKPPESVIGHLWDIAYSALYICYDIEADFLHQFRAMAPKLKKILSQQKDKYYQMAEVVSNGE